MLVAGFAAIPDGFLPFVSSKWIGEQADAVMTRQVRKGDSSVTVAENGMLESSNHEEIKCLVKGGSTALWVFETGTFFEPSGELV